MTENNKNSKLGLYCAAASLAVWLFVVFKIVLNLPVKLDTLILLSWPILPGIIGGYIFYRMDKTGRWR